jgi:hypothetical protein
MCPTTSSRPCCPRRSSTAIECRKLRGRCRYLIGWPIAAAPFGDPRAALRAINHELCTANPLPASAENLQEDFSSKLNKDLSTNCLAGRRLPAPATDRNRRWLRDRRCPRRCLRRRRRPSRSAAGCPLLIAFIARDTFCADDPSISPLPIAAAASVASFRKPRRRPAGLPDYSDWNACVRAPEAAQSRRSSPAVAYCLYTECDIASIAMIAPPS